MAKDKSVDIFYINNKIDGNNHSQGRAPLEFNNDDLLQDIVPSSSPPIDIPRTRDRGIFLDEWDDDTELQSSEGSAILACSPERNWRWQEHYHAPSYDEVIDVSVKIPEDPCMIFDTHCDSSSEDSYYKSMTGDGEIQYLFGDIPCFFSITYE